MLEVRCALEEGKGEGNAKNVELWAAYQSARRGSATAGGWTDHWCRSLARSVGCMNWESQANEIGGTIFDGVPVRAALPQHGCPLRSRLICSVAVEHKPSARQWTSEDLIQSRAPRCSTVRSGQLPRRGCAKPKWLTVYLRNGLMYYCCKASRAAYVRSTEIVHEKVPCSGRHLTYVCASTSTSTSSARTRTWT